MSSSSGDLEAPNSPIFNPSSNLQINGTSPFHLEIPPTSSPNFLQVLPLQSKTSQNEYNTQNWQNGHEVEWQNIENNRQIFFDI